MSPIPTQREMREMKGWQWRDGNIFPEARSMNGCTNGWWIIPEITIWEAGYCTYRLAEQQDVPVFSQYWPFYLYRIGVRIWVDPRYIPINELLHPRCAPEVLDNPNYFRLLVFPPSPFVDMNMGTENQQRESVEYKTFLKVDDVHPMVCWKRIG